ncbi:DUF6230 family protein [Streptomyces similanensis]|uniref:Cholesterol esterase n=1 Tax=Streptomyces similanensis TaxID=1274988 RepID=A0ABP9JPX0_9ACTN
MTEPAHPPHAREPAPAVEGRTHWRRASLLAAPAAVAAAALVASMATGALAVEFRAQGTPLQLTTSSLYGHAYGAATVDQPVTRADGSAGTVPVLRMAFADGRVNGLCLSQRQRALGMTYTVLLTLDDKDPATWEVRTGPTVIDLVSASGVLDLDGVVDINVNGRDAGAGADGPGVALGSGPDRFGLRADYAKFHSIDARIQDIQIPGALTTPGLTIDVRPGAVQCPAPQPPKGTPAGP